MSDIWKPVVVEHWRPGVNNSRVSETVLKTKAKLLQRLVPWAALFMAGLMLTAFVIFGAISGGVASPQNPGALPTGPLAADNNIAALMRQMQAAPENADILTTLAELFLEQGDAAAAEEFARKALQIEPEHDRAAGILESALSARQASTAEQTDFPEILRQSVEPDTLLLPGSTLHWSQPAQ